MKRITLLTILVFTLIIITGCQKSEEKELTENKTVSEKNTSLPSDKHITPESGNNQKNENSAVSEPESVDIESSNPANTAVFPLPEGKFSGKVICIDPGHGITTRKETEPVYPGATEKKAANVSGTRGKNITEEAFNLDISLKLKNEFEKHGAIVHITRTTHESDMSNIERAEFANEKKCDIVVRIHADGSESSTASGISMLIPSKNRVTEGYLTPEIIQNSRRAGEYVLKDVCENTGAKNKGIVERADMTGFNWSSVPVILLETGFLTNPQEEALLITDEYQQKIIAGIITGLEKYFNE